MSNLDLQQLEQFIIRAKAVTYIGAGKKLLPYRLASKDLQFTDGDWAYHDSYFGEIDFIGQEVVYHERRPVWGLNYMGQILHDDLITAPEAGAMLMKSLSRMYKEGRFLGGFTHSEGGLVYRDESEGTVAAFTGREWIERGGVVVYRLQYHGGLIRG